jgi:hypothetical protein
LRRARPRQSGFEATGRTLIAGLLALAILEHWFLVLPLHDAAPRATPRGLPRTVP